MPSEFVFRELAWEQLIEGVAFKTISNMDIRDEKDKMVHFYHMTVIKFLVNGFQQAWGRNALLENVQPIIEFCTTAFGSCNAKVVSYGATLLFNMLVCYDNNKATNTSSKEEELEPVMKEALKEIIEIIGEKRMQPCLGTGENEGVLYALLMCECRLLFENDALCSWVEKKYARQFSSVHDELKDLCSEKRTLDAIEDV